MDMEVTKYKANLPGEGFVEVTEKKVKQTSKPKNDIQKDPAHEEQAKVHNVAANLLGPHNIQKGS